MAAVLLDHFHPPLSARRHWHSFHAAWAGAITADLNNLLPDGYFAEQQVQFHVEIDVAAFDERGSVSSPLKHGPPLRTETLTAPAWSPPSPTMTLPLQPSAELVEVRVFSEEGGATLAAAVELVSPGNKDRKAERDAFVTKCLAILHQGAGVTAVDIVTSRSADLHATLVQQLGASPVARDGALSAVAYRPVIGSESATLDIWVEPLALGRQLPVVPLFVKGLGIVPLRLALSYERACSELRIATS